MSSPVLSIVAIGLLSLASVRAATVTYQIDLGSANNPQAEGFELGEIVLQSVDVDENGSKLAGIDPEFTAVDVNGANPISVAFSGTVGGYSLNNVEKPLSTDGIYTFENKPDEATDIPYTISGLPPGATVTLYAMSAWDGDGRAAFLSLGDSGLVDLRGSREPLPGEPLHDAFIVVASGEKVGPEGKLSGVFSNSDGSRPRAEGQWGAMILVVETP